MKAARDRKIAAGIKCGGRKSYAESNPALERAAGRTAAAKPAPDIRPAGRAGLHQPGAAICGSVGVGDAGARGAVMNISVLNFALNFLVDGRRPASAIANFLVNFQRNISLVLVDGRQFLNAARDGPLSTRHSIFTPRGDGHNGLTEGPPSLLGSLFSCPAPTGPAGALLPRGRVWQRPAPWTHRRPPQRVSRACWRWVSASSCARCLSLLPSGWRVWAR
jgi:hypothetical protein